jgi:hypothetical protein
MWGSRSFLLVVSIAVIALVVSINSVYAFPYVDFGPGTAGSGDSIFVNVSASDATNNVSTFIDFDSSLVSWWRMDDINGTGDPTDYMDRNNGTAINESNQTDDGYFGKGFEFNWYDYLDLGNPGSLNFNTGGFAINLWFKSYNISYDEAETLIGKRPPSGGNGDIYIIITQTGKIEAAIHDGAAQGIGDTFVVRDGNWHMVTLNVNTTDAVIYVNGTYRGIASHDNSLTTNTNPWKIARGRSAGFQEYFNGSIDDVMIFNRSLSTAEIGALYANQTSKYLERNFTGLSYGQHAFKAYAQDTLGNVNSTALNNVLLNATPPQITITSPLPTAYYTRSIALEWTVDRPIDWAGYSLNGAGNISLLTETEQDAEDSASCSGSFQQACSNATDEDWNTYAECTSSQSCEVFENYTIPVSVSWANWTYKIYKVDGITAYSTYYWNYSSNGWSILDTTDVGEATYFRNVSIPSDGLNGTILRIRNPIESFATKRQRYYEGKVTWPTPINTTFAAIGGDNLIELYANDTSGNIGSSSVSFEYVPPKASVQLILTLDNLANDVYIPGTGTIASASITNTTYSSPTHWYLASYLDNVLNALVFSYQTPSLMSVNRTAATHSIIFSQDVQNSKSFLVFTSGDWKTVDSRMELIENREFLLEPSPSFARGLGIGYIVKILLSYGNIDIVDDLIMQSGSHDIIAENTGRSGPNRQLRIRSL